MDLEITLEQNYRKFYWSFRCSKIMCRYNVKKHSILYLSNKKLFKKKIYILLNYVLQNITMTTHVLTIGT